MSGTRLLTGDQRRQTFGDDKVVVVLVAGQVLVRDMDVGDVGRRLDGVVLVGQGQIVIFRLAVVYRRPVDGWFLHLGGRDEAMISRRGCLSFREAN